MEVEEIEAVEEVAAAEVAAAVVEPSTDPTRAVLLMRRACVV